MATGLLGAYALILLLGIVIQRITGMGSNLVIAPFVVLALGPYEGVFAVNVIGAITAAVCAPALINHVDWGVLFRLLVGAVVGIFPGVLIASALPSDMLTGVIGLLLLAGVWLPKLLWGGGEYLMTWRVVLAAGFAAGSVNVMSGAGGLPLAVLALATGWKQRRFAATFQPFYVVIASMCALISWLLQEDVHQPLPAWQWLMTFIILFGGSFIGTWIARRFSEKRARQGMTVVATIGSLNLLIGSVL